MADTVELDVESLTMEEIETLEDLTSKPMSALFPANAMTALGLRGAYFLIARRSNPALTWEETAGVTISSVTEQVKADPPTDAPG